MPESVAGGGGAGWGLSNFEIVVTKAAGLWRQKWDGMYWDGTNGDPKLDFFDVSSLSLSFLASPSPNGKEISFPPFFQREPENPTIMTRMHR